MSGEQVNRRTLGYQQAAANNGARGRHVSGDGWYTFQPATIPRVLAEWAALTAKQWRDGDPSFKCTLLAGNMSTDTLLAWLKDFETKRAQTLVRVDGTKLFSKVPRRMPTARPGA